MGSGPFPARIKGKWDQINGFVFISTREGAWLKRFQQEIEELGQVSWIETKGMTDKRGIIGTDPFFVFL